MRAQKTEGDGADNDEEKRETSKEGRPTRSNKIGFSSHSTAPPSESTDCPTDHNGFADTSILTQFSDESSAIVRYLRRE